MRLFITFLFAGFLISMASCRNDFDFEPSSGNLRFSRDTVYLDTVFTNIGSSTYTLKVYNRSDKDISIPEIKLGKGQESKYRITVDGMTGNNNRVFNNVELLANDSLFVFIEVTTDVASANPDDFFYTDQIQFGVGSGLQTVELVTLIQDAVFLYPQRFEDGTYESININGEPRYGFILDENDHGNEYNMTAEKPYVIYGYAAVPNGKTLTVQPGARIHCHADSGIIIGTGGAIAAGGSNPAPESEVVFEGDRLEPFFADVPGQWFGIWITSGAAASSFNNVTIKNAEVGIWVQDNASGLTLRDVQIYDHSFYGILGTNATITGENVVVNNAGIAALAATFGGNYSFTHCTFNNNWQSSSQFAVDINNYLVDESNNPVPQALVKADFVNCIIYGSNSRSFRLRKDNGADFNYKFDHCLLKFNNTGFESDPLYQFSDGVNYININRNGNPRFWDIGKNQLNIETNSAAVGLANTSFLIPFDVINVARTTNDAGAYQSADIPDPQG